MSGTANSGRRPQPASVAAMKGNPTKLKHRVTETPLPDGAPSMPETLGAEGMRVWQFVCAQCAAVPGMLKQIDEFSLGMFCHAIEDVWQIRTKLRADGKTVADLPVTARKALREAEGTAIKIGARFGWSPSDRVGKVFGADGGPKDPLAELLKAREN